MKPTLTQVVTLSLFALMLILALLFYVVFDSSRATVIEGSERIRERAVSEIGERVTTFLEKAPATVQQFQGEVNRGLFNPREPIEIERALVSLLLANPDAGEITFTFADKTGFDSQGDIELAPSPRGQLSVNRSTNRAGELKLLSRFIHQEGTEFVADWRELKPTVNFTAQPVKRESGDTIADPTSQFTFTTPANRDYYGTPQPSELHRSELDLELPEEQRRVEVSVQQVIQDSAGNFSGVLRVGLLAAQLGKLVQMNVSASQTGDPHLIFLCDAQGRVISQSTPADPFVDFDIGLRIASDHLPAVIAKAVSDPKLAQVNLQHPKLSGQFEHGGEEYLTTFQALPKTQDWIAGIVVPRAFYLGKLNTMRNRLLAISLAMIALILAGGIAILRGIRRAQLQVVKESLRMNAFEFSPASTESPFRDVSEVLESLEKAKAAMRAMGKYVPIDLVRKLYREKSEPVLGGEPMEVSVMFTDIKDFTAFSESLPPDKLANALGLYLDVMARIIQQEARGTIDKYIGDAIMTLWNAPEPIPNHARMACLAAIRCREAGRELAASVEWKDLPPFETRFGLHCDEALVGHFGAHDRMNYTAIGDGINLAARLESLNKQYGTSIIASDRVMERASEEYDFRLLDWVAVKGKSQPVKIYELLGRKGTVESQRQIAGQYEKAFAAYVNRDFRGALVILEAQTQDLPSVTLAERCRLYLEDPPDSAWTGVYISTSK